MGFSASGITVGGRQQKIIMITFRVCTGLALMLYFSLLYSRFGRPSHDEMSILSPLNQCCMIRYTTFLKLIKLYLGPDRLSILMRQSMKRDITNPILTEPHLIALDRRVIKILIAIHDCLQDIPYTDVIVDDFF